jgi:hypothetical protein
LSILNPPKGYLRLGDAPGEPKTCPFEGEISLYEGESIGQLWLRTGS